MAIYVRTNNPQSLLKKIRAAIDDERITTWSYDKDGDFTHNVDQWRERAWIGAKIDEERIIFYAICRKDKDMSIIEYAVFHGRFVEMLLSHFDTECQDISVTPLATKYDRVKSNPE